MPFPLASDSLLCSRTMTLGACEPLCSCPRACDTEPTLVDCVSPALASHLELQGCQFTALLPNITAMPALQQLDLSSNNFNANVLTALLATGSTSLQTLGLHYNSAMAGATIPATVTNLAAIRYARSPPPPVSRMPISLPSRHRVLPCDLPHAVTACGCQSLDHGRLRARRHRAIDADAAESDAAVFCWWKPAQRQRSCGAMVGLGTAVGGSEAEFVSVDVLLGVHGLQ